MNIRPIATACGWLVIGVCLGLAFAPKAEPPVTPITQPAAAAVQAPAMDTRTIRVDGREITVGARDRVTFEHKDTVVDVGASSKSDRRASTVGVGLETESEQAAQSFKAENAQTGLDDVGFAAGGGFSYSGKLSGGSGMNVFHAIGAACLLGALAFVVVPLLLKGPPRLGTAGVLAAGGVAFIAIGESIKSMPWAWAIAGLLILAGLGWWVFMAVRTNGLTKALGGRLATAKDTVTALVTAISKLDAATKGVVKSKLDEVLAGWTPEERGAVERDIVDTKTGQGL